MGVSINTHKSLGIGIHTYIVPPPVSGFTNTYSLLLDGVNDYAETDATYSQLDGDTNASFSMWVKPISGGATTRMVFHIGVGGSGFASQCQLWLFEGNRLDFSINGGGTYGRANISGLTYGSWNHIVIAIDLPSTDEFKCYINGVDATTGDNLTSIASFPTASDELYIGESKTSYQNPFYGNIDEFAIWSGTTLTLSDAQAIYNSGTPNDLNNNGLTAPTTWYRMGDNDGGTGTTLTDAAGSANGTLVNSASYDTDVP